jgi:hypothetical protein
MEFTHHQLVNLIIVQGRLIRDLIEALEKIAPGALDEHLRAARLNAQHPEEKSTAQEREIGTWHALLLESALKRGPMPEGATFQGVSPRE